MPPSPKTQKASDFDEEDPEHTLGHAVLFGHLEMEPETGGYVLKGEWRHVQGPLQGGAFEMKLHENGLGNGWWAGCEQGDRNPWEWNPELEPLTNTGGEERVTQTRRSSLVSLGSMNSSLLQRSLSIRPSMSNRLDRSKTFFDELLESEGTSSVWIARWGVFCAWVFFFQTSIALIMATLQVTDEYVYILQCFFQAVYTSTYTSFLLIYARMATKPPWDYVMGVLLYTLGYACFLALYVMILVVEDAEVITEASGKIYLSGSLFFLVGSLSLVRATLPPPIMMVFRSLSRFDHARLRFSLIDQQASLFWGSITFLLGSCCFCIDSAWSLWHPESKPTWFVVVSSVAGYFVFTIGRLYFLWGSTTSECNALFFKTGSIHAWAEHVCAPLSDLLKYCLALGKAAPDDCPPHAIPRSKGKAWLDVCCEA
jgi:hypothetical protein